jgi:hypothetical protein
MQKRISAIEQKRESKRWKGHIRWGRDPSEQG